MEKRDYSDILYLPRPVSKRHKPMDRINRAAQFSPFAALTGYEGVIREEARLTAPRPEMGEEERSLLNQKLSVLLECQAAHPTVTAVYYRRDEKKEGGEVVFFTGALRDLNEAEGKMTFTTGEELSFPDLVDLQSDLFVSLE
ncbi:MAG: hypothetical protein J6Z79_00315 [Clostridia bacterium]|nr:hypothetical protein [Clostridia bacterium]